MSVALKQVRGITSRERENRLVLNGVDWKSYCRMGELFLDRQVRMTYCDGVLEIMTLSSRNEFLKGILARLVEAAFMAREMPYRSFGSMTCLRDDLEKGLEPDECYWVSNADALGERQDIDLNRDPPPDLAIEIKASRRIKERWKIYRELRVTEVWNWSGDEVVFHALRGAKYQVVKRSKVLPSLSSSEATRFAKRMIEEGNLKGLRAFQEWLEE